MDDHIDFIFFCTDEFCKIYEEWEKNRLISHNRQRFRECKMSLSERLTVAILYHFLGHKNFKLFYHEFVLKRRDLFPNPLSYSRFVELMPRLIIPLCALIHHLKGEQTGTYYIDSTKLQICHNKRTSRNKVFRGIAAMGMSSYGWFFGMKLHVITNEIGEIMAVKITRGNVDDRAPVEELAAGLEGKLFADKGYISKDLWQKLWKKSMQLFHGIKKNMKNYLIDIKDKILLRKRSLIETVFSVCKKNMDLEHTRHRSPKNFIVNTLSCIVAYQFRTITKNQNKMKILIPN